MKADDALNQGFSEFVNKVFTGCGERQKLDLEMVFFAGVFCATQQIARCDDLLEVHQAAYKILEQHNEFCLQQIGKKP